MGKRTLKPQKKKYIKHFLPSLQTLSILRTILPTRLQLMLRVQSSDSLFFQKSRDFAHFCDLFSKLGYAAKHAMNIIFHLWNFKKCKMITIFCEALLILVLYSKRPDLNCPVQGTVRLCPHY